MYKHFEPPKCRKAYAGNHDEFVCFEHGIAKVKLTLNDGNVYNLYLHAEQEELHVACSCGMPDEKLCFHAFIGLFNLSWLSNKFDCQVLYWPGFYSDEVERRFLDVKFSKSNIRIEAKPEFGAVYRSRIGLGQYSFPKLESHSGNAYSIKGGDTELYAFALCFADDAYRNRHYPVLVPFYGRTNKSGLIVDTFSNFVLPDKHSRYDDGHTDWKVLNGYSRTMYELMRPLTYQTDTRDKHAWRQAKLTIFGLWQSALPLLIHSSYNHSYLLYHYRYLRERPSKMFMRPCRYSLERPVLVFLLSIKKGYLKLSVEVRVGSQVIPVEDKPHFFIFDKQAGYRYLMKSIQDDELLNWMVDHNNCLTVLNGDFEEFDKTVLSKIAKGYDVLFSDRNKNRPVYNREDVINKLAGEGKNKEGWHEGK